MKDIGMPAEDVLAAIGRAFPDLIFIIDREGRYIAALGGKDPSKYHDPETLPKLHGLTFRDVMPPELAERMLAAVEHTLHENAVHTITYSLNEADIPGYADQAGPKEMQWFEARLSPIRQQGSTPDGIVALVYNITERLQIEARLERLAHTDELTGLPNRRAFMECASITLATARRYRQPAALAMIDIDHFKQVNDRLGHAGGDAVLKQFAELALEHLRESDILARFGGEEFALLLPLTGVQESRIVIDRLCRAMNEARFRFGRHEFGVSISAGIAASPPHAGDIATLIQGADKALYLAKRQGRNRVVVFEKA
ncbi:MAG TPA: diguanylate cyclase [Gammaproteobacteria bacterium]